MYGTIVGIYLGGKNSGEYTIRPLSMVIFNLDLYPVVAIECRNPSPQKGWLQYSHPSQTVRYMYLATVDGSEIPNNHLGSKNTLCK